MVGLSCLSRQNRPEWLLVQHIDYGPTFVDLAGGKVPAGLHGRSFAPILRGQTPADWRKSIYYHYYDGGHGVAKHYGLRTEKFTLARFYTTDEWELFDNEKEPNQLRVHPRSSCLDWCKL